MVAPLLDLLIINNPLWYLTGRINIPELALLVISIVTSQPVGLGFESLLPGFEAWMWWPVVWFSSRLCLCCCVFSFLSSSSSSVVVSCMLWLPFICGFVDHNTSEHSLRTWTQNILHPRQRSHLYNDMLYAAQSRLQYHQCKGLKKPAVTGDQVRQSPNVRQVVWVVVMEMWWLEAA